MQKSKFMLISLLPMILDNTSNGMENHKYNVNNQNLNYNFTGSLKNQEQRKKWNQELWETIDKSFNANIEVKAKYLMENGVIKSKKEYWAHDALVNKNGKFTKSMENLKTLIFHACNATKEEHDAWQKDMLLATMIGLEKYLAGGKSIEAQRHLLGLINGIIIGDGIYTFFDQLNTSNNFIDRPAVEKLFTTVFENFKKQYQNILETLNENKDTKEILSNNKIEVKSLDRFFIDMESNLNISSSNSWVDVVKHDFEVYLQQFYILFDDEINWKKGNATRLDSTLHEVINWSNKQIKECKNCNELESRNGCNDNILSKRIKFESPSTRPTKLLKQLIEGQGAIRELEVEMGCSLKYLSEYCNSEEFKKLIEEYLLTQSNQPDDAYSAKKISKFASDNKFMFALSRFYKLYCLLLGCNKDGIVNDESLIRTESVWEFLYSKYGESQLENVKKIYSNMSNNMYDLIKLFVAWAHLYSCGEFRDIVFGLGGEFPIPEDENSYPVWIKKLTGEELGKRAHIGLLHKGDKCKALENNLKRIGNGCRELILEILEKMKSLKSALTPSIAKTTKFCEYINKDKFWRLALAIAIRYGNVYEEYKGEAFEKLRKLYSMFVEKTKSSEEPEKDFPDFLLENGLLWWKNVSSCEYNLIPCSIPCSSVDEKIKKRKEEFNKEVAEKVKKAEEVDKFVANIKKNINNIQVKKPKSINKINRKKVKEYIEIARKSEKKTEMMTKCVATEIMGNLPDEVKNTMIKILGLDIKDLEYLRFYLNMPKIFRDFFLTSSNPIVIKYDYSQHNPAPICVFPRLGSFIETVKGNRDFAKNYKEYQGYPTEEFCRSISSDFLSLMIACFDTIGKDEDTIIGKDDDRIIEESRSEWFEKARQLLIGGETYFESSEDSDDYGGIIFDIEHNSRRVSAFVICPSLSYNTDNFSEINNYDEINVSFKISEYFWSVDVPGIFSNAPSVIAKKFLELHNKRRIEDKFNKVMELVSGVCEESLVTISNVLKKCSEKIAIANSSKLKNIKKYPNVKIIDYINVLMRDNLWQ